MIFHTATQPGAKHKRKRMPILTLPFLAPPGASKFPLVYVGDDALFDNLKQPLHMRMGRKCNLPNNAPRCRCQCLDGQCRKFAQQLPQKKTNLSNSHVTWQRYLALAGQEKRKVKKTKHTVEENKYSPSPSHKVLRVFQALYSTHLSSKPNALPGVFWSYHFP